jgi:hypothetical protein
VIVMRSRQSLLLVVGIALAWGGSAAAQSTPQGGGARPVHGAQNQAAPPANSAGTSTMPGTQTPVNQPATTPGMQTPVNQPNTSAQPSAPTPSPANTSPPPSTPAQPSSSMPQQTVSPNQPNSATSARDTDSATRARTARQTDAVPPASRGVGATANRPDCSQKRGLEKSECERRDTVRDDLPAGVTTAQQPKPPQ